MKKNTYFYKSLDEALTATRILMVNRRSVTINPAFIYNPETGLYDIIYAVDEIFIVVRTAEEIAQAYGKTVSQLRDEIIEIQSQVDRQYLVTNELYRRYLVSPSEANELYRVTRTYVPSKYNTLEDYKRSGRWPMSETDKPMEYVYNMGSPIDYDKSAMFGRTAQNVFEWPLPPVPPVEPAPQKKTIADDIANVDRKELAKLLKRRYTKKEISKRLGITIYVLNKVLKEMDSEKK